MVRSEHGAVAMDPASFDLSLLAACGLLIAFMHAIVQMVTQMVPGLSKRLIQAAVEARLLYLSVASPQLFQ